MFWNGTPGHHVIEDQIAACDDRVATRLRAGARTEGSLGPVPPTGYEEEVRAIALHRIAGGKIVEHWSRLMGPSCCIS